MKAIARVCVEHNEGDALKNIRYATTVGFPTHRKRKAQRWFTRGRVARYIYRYIPLPYICHLPLICMFSNFGFDLSLCASYLIYYHLYLVYNVIYYNLITTLPPVK